MSKESHSPKIKLLLADDEIISALFLKDGLQHLGYLIHMVHNGADAVAAYSRESFDLVILDLVMPIMGGKDAYFKMLEMDPRVKAIFITGFDTNQDIQELMKHGSPNILRKPFTLDTLHHTIQHILIH